MQYKFQKVFKSKSLWVLKNTVFILVSMKTVFTGYSLCFSSLYEATFKSNDKIMFESLFKFS